MNKYNKINNELSLEKDKFIQSYKDDAKKTVQYVKNNIEKLDNKNVTKALKTLSKKKLSNILGNLDNVNNMYHLNQNILQNRLHELFETFYYVIKLNVTISKILLDKTVTKEEAGNKIYGIKDGDRRVFTKEQVEEILSNVDLNTYLYKQFQSKDELSGGADPSNQSGSTSQCTLCEYEWMIFYLWYLENSEIGPFVTDYLNILVSYLSFFDMFMNLISSIIVGSFQVMTMGTLGPVYRIMRTYIEGIGSSMLFMINISRKRLDEAYSNFIQTFPKLTTVIDFSTTQLTNMNYFLDRSQYYTDYINNNSKEIVPIVEDYMQANFKIFDDIMNESMRQVEFMRENMENIAQINISPQVQTWGYPYSTLTYLPRMNTPLPPLPLEHVGKDIWTAMLPGMDVSYFKCCQTCNQPKKKYIAVDTSTGVCRETCLDDKSTQAAKQMVPNLQESQSTCRDSGYIRYKQTDNVANQPFRFDIYQQDFNQSLNVGNQASPGQNFSSSSGSTSFNPFSTSPEKKAEKEAKKLAKKEEKAAKKAEKQEKKEAKKQEKAKKKEEKKERKEAMKEKERKEMEELGIEKKSLKTRLRNKFRFRKKSSDSDEGSDSDDSSDSDSDSDKGSSKRRWFSRNKKSDSDDDS